MTFSRDALKPGQLFSGGDDYGLCLAVENLNSSQPVQALVFRQGLIPKLEELTAIPDPIALRPGSLEVMPSPASEFNMAEVEEMPVGAIKIDRAHGAVVMAKDDLNRRAEIILANGLRARSGFAGARYFSIWDCHVTEAT